jgi:hypothetical protein
MYRVGYIDDEEININNLKIDSRNVLEIVQIEPMEDIDELLYNVFDLNLDGIIIDQCLNISSSKIHYTGIEVLNKIEMEMLDFPSVVLTAYEDSAESEYQVESFRIYDKSVYSADPERFIRKIKKQIENYKYRIELKTKQYFELCKKDNLDNKEEELKIEIDDYLEKVVCKRNKMPSSLKKSSNEERLDKLIELAKKTLEEVEKYGK